MTDPKTITISREVLRLELDNLALRLTSELATKGEVADLERRQDAFDRGEMSTGMLLAIKAVVLQELNNRLTGTWALRANKAAWAVVFIALASLGVSLANVLSN